GTFLDGARGRRLAGALPARPVGEGYQRRLADAGQKEL
ncbi:MAG: hypothetical protein AVDCRST_MAG93-6817, partial [uncultured Chloroflexia bacterium]